MADTLSRGLEPTGRAARAAALGVRVLVTLTGAALMGWAALADAHWAERHVLPAYCATSRAEWILARAVPWIGAALGVAAVWKLAPALGSLTARASLRGRGAAAAGVAVAVAAALAVGELAARGVHDRVMLGRWTAPGGGSAPMTRPDARLGWSYFPGRTTWTRMAGRSVAYAIDAGGDRAASSDERPDPARPTILFAGESIAFGYGLPWEETFAHQVGRDLGVQAVNLAVVGYGSDQAHLRVVEALPRFARPLAVVTLFIPGQLRRNVERWRPRLRLAGGVLVAAPASGGPRLARLLDELPLRGDEALAVTAAILRETARAARARGAFPLFVVTNYGAPCLRDGGEPWIVDELFARQGLPFVQVDLQGEDLLPGALERHPGPPGARKIADAIERALSARLGTAPAGVRL